MSVEIWSKRDLCDRYRSSTYPGSDCDTVRMHRGRLVKLRKLKPPAALARTLLYRRTRCVVCGLSAGVGHAESNAFVKRVLF